MRGLLAFLLLHAVAGRAGATPPILSGDVPTAEKGVVELYLGHQLEKTDGEREHELPGVEVIYGLSRRQEVSIEVPLLTLDHSAGSTTGFGDVKLGTKYRLLGAPESDAGLSASLEVKLPTGSSRRGLGSGATDVELLARWGWEIQREVIYVNLGHTWVGASGARNVTFTSGVWEHPLKRNVNLLTEVYHETADAPGAPDRLAATLGLKWQLREKQRLNISVGRSLRADASGGPKLRLYAGVKLEF